MLTNFELKQLKPKLDIVKKPENRVHELTDSNVSRLMINIMKEHNQIQSLRSPSTNETGRNVALVSIVHAMSIGTRAPLGPSTPSSTSSIFENGNISPLLYLHNVNDKLSEGPYEYVIIVTFVRMSYVNLRARK